MEKKDPKSKNSQVTEDPAVTTSGSRAGRVLRDDQGNITGVEINGEVIKVLNYDQVEGNLQKNVQMVTVASHKQEVLMPVELKGDFTPRTAPSLTTVLTVYKELVDAGKMPFIPVEETQQHLASIKEKAAEMRRRLDLG